MTYALVAAGALACGFWLGLKFAGMGIKGMIDEGLLKPVPSKDRVLR